MFTNSKTVKAVASVLASLALMTVASAASANTFTQGGQAVTASGTLVQNIINPSDPSEDFTTHCAVQLNGTVASNGSSITFTSYTGTNTNGGPLACDDSITFPIVATAPNASTISLDQFIVGTRFFSCAETNYQLAYSGNTATFSGAPFGQPFPICIASGTLSLTTNSGNTPVLINP